MAALEPEVRGRYMKIFLRRVDQLPPGDRDAVRAASPPWALRAIDDVAPLDWLPGAVNTEITKAVSGQLEPSRAHGFYKTLLVNVFESALLNTFVEGVLRMAGRDPGKSLKWVQKGFSLIFRNWGTWTVLAARDQDGEMEVRNLPPICMDEEGVWIASARDSLHSIYVRAGRRGTVRIADRDDARGYVRYAFEWQ